MKHHTFLSSKSTAGTVGFFWGLNYYLFYVYENIVLKISRVTAWMDGTWSFKEWTGQWEVSTMSLFLVPRKCFNYFKMDEEAIEMFLLRLLNIWSDLCLQMWCVQFWCDIMGNRHFSNPLEGIEPNAGCWGCWIPEQASWNPWWDWSRGCPDNTGLLAKVISIIS